MARLRTGGAIVFEHSLSFFDKRVFSVQSVEHCFSEGSLSLFLSLFLPIYLYFSLYFSLYRKADIFRTPTLFRVFLPT